MREEEKKILQIYQNDDTIKYMDNAERHKTFHMNELE